MGDQTESTQRVIRALSNEKRMQMLEWLLDPTVNFPQQRDGDLIEDGVCVGAITDKIGLSQPTVTNHLRSLAEAKLVTYRPIKNWVFYKADRPFVLKALSDLRARFEAK